MNRLFKRVILYEITGFTVVVMFLWLDEMVDFPHLVFGMQASPINIGESVWETIIILLLAILVAIFTRKLFRRIKVLEGLLPTCSVCKKIRIGKKEWEKIEIYITNHSEAEFTHSFCPECVKELYGHEGDVERESSDSVNHEVES